MKDWWKYLFVVLLTLVAGGLVILVSSPPRGEPVALQPPPTPAPILVHVAGAVIRPGLYSLPYGSRVQDAIDAAGGLAPDADIQRLNLAAFVKDSEQLLVPAIQPTTIPATITPALGRGGATPRPSATPGGCIDINHASQAELESLPYIGPATAQKIIAYRETHGPFPNVDAIIEVNGIGDKTFEQIKNLICVK